jgi:iron complex transport system substrate-binding protein
MSTINTSTVLLKNSGSQGFLRLFLFVSAFAGACGQSPQSGRSATTDKSATTDSAPAPAAADGNSASTATASTETTHSLVKYAHGFRIDHRSGYREVSIVNRGAGRTDTLHYILVDGGQTAPTDRPGVPVIHTPIKTLTVLSSAHIALVDFAGVADRIVGLGNFQYISSPIVRENIRTGKIKQVGIDGSTNNELVIALHPGAMITSSNPDAAFGQYKTITDAGIPVLPDAEWLETTPLGRAEWVKLVGALVDKEDIVGKKFDSVEEAYNDLAALGSSAKTKPSVIIAMPFKGVWYTPAGESYMARFLHDAGANYHWADSKGTGSLPLNVEAVIPVALKADYWLNVGYVDSRKDIAAKDKRFSEFHAFRTDSVYNFNKRVNDIGANDYWESGIVNPHLVLADMIRILHPGLLPRDTLYYYKQLK